MAPITIYTTSVCPYCIQAKRLLSQRGIAFDEVNLESQPDLRQRLSAENGGYRTVPMIFIGKQFIGGFQELALLDANQKLKSMVAASSAK